MITYSVITTYIRQHSHRTLESHTSIWLHGQFFNPLINRPKDIINGLKPIHRQNILTSPYPSYYLPNCIAEISDIHLFSYSQIYFPREFLLLLHFPRCQIHQHLLLQFQKGLNHYYHEKSPSVSAIKKGIRTISFSKTKYDHTVPFNKKQGILPFSDLLIFKKASLMWQVTHDYTPLSITNLFERNQHNRLRYVLPRVKYDYEKNRLVYSCIKSWNLFSDSIKKFINLLIIKLNTKNNYCTSQPSGSFSCLAILKSRRVKDTVWHGSPFFPIDRVPFLPSGTLPKIST